MNISLMDEYVYLVLMDNGWTEKRNFLVADSWVEKIEQSGIQSSGYAREILHLFGGMKFREFSPKSGQYFLEKCNGDVSRLEKWYLRPLERLNSLSEKKSVDAYNGATFTFDAWNAFLDLEIVIDLKIAEQVVGEKLFPIGTVEPDGIICAAESRNIYTLFSDSIFLSGDCIENFLNMLFIHGQKPKQLDSVYRKYMESVVAMLFANILTYHIADLWKFTYYYPLFEIAHFGKMRKSLEFLYF